MGALIVLSSCFLSLDPVPHVCVGVVHYPGTRTGLTPQTSSQYCRMARSEEK